MAISIFAGKLRAGRRFAPSALFWVLLLALRVLPCEAVTITVKNEDNPGEGFNDPTPVAPVGGNTATTLGQQRLRVFQYAADAWGLRLAGAIPVIIGATFDPLPGDVGWAVLGAAGPTTAHVNFQGAQRADTWYVAAVANELSGVDQNDIGVPGGMVEVAAQFNSDVDGPVVLGDMDFYYGLDGNPPGTDIEFLIVILHEIAHGLGFLDLIDYGTGAKFNGLNDAYMIWLEDQIASPKALSAMTNPQRKTAMTDTGNLFWVGPLVKAASGILTTGRRDDGAVLMYAPNPYELGSSVSHFDISVDPNELMEPYINVGIRDLRLTTALLQEVGWTPVHVFACGDADDDEQTSPTDALLALRTAVGSYACPEYVCDVDFSGVVMASDALVMLRVAVGAEVAMQCPLADL